MPLEKSASAVPSLCPDPRFSVRAFPPSRPLVQAPTVQVVTCWLIRSGPTVVSWPGAAPPQSALKDVGR